VDPGESLLVTGDIGLVTDGAPLEELGGRTRRLRAFLGHSGWGPGQLDRELQDNGWFVVPCDDALIFDGDYDGKWARALAKLGGTLGKDPGLFSSTSGRA
jgi:putative transcriptional regulator